MMHLTTKWAVLAICTLLFASSAFGKEGHGLVIGLIGDSTVCDYPATSPKRGWGQMLKEFLRDDTVIVNEARGGASTLSFPPENWKRVREARPDFIFIQFGHNDMKKEDPKRYADPATGYRENLRRFIKESREIGAVPVLVTPVSRRKFRNGRVTTELAPYADAVKAVGSETGVAVIDLNTASRDLFQQLGEDGSDAYTANKIQNPDAVRPDRTHFTETGAREIARLVVDEFPKLAPRLAEASTQVAQEE